MCLFCFFKQKTAYELRISDWSSDVCSSDLPLDTDYENVYTNGAAGEGPGSEPAFATRGAAASGDDEYSLHQRLSDRVTLRQHLTEHIHMHFSDPTARPLFVCLIVQLLHSRYLSLLHLLSAHFFSPFTYSHLFFLLLLSFFL